MYGRDPQHRSLAASDSPSRQVDFDDPFWGSDDDGAGSPARVPYRRRAVVQASAVVAVCVAAMLVVTATGSGVRSGFGPDDGPSSDQAALELVLDGVVGRVEAENVEATEGDQSAEYGAGAIPRGLPPAPPGDIGRHTLTPGGTDLGPGPPIRRGTPSSNSDGMALIALPPLDEDDAGTGEPDASPGDSTDAVGPAGPNVSVSTSGVTTGSTGATNSSTPPRPTTTRRSTTTRPVVITAAVTTPPPTTPAPTPSTTAEPTITTAAITTTTATTASTTSPTPPASCVVVVTGKAKLQATPSNSSAVLGNASAGTYSVSERHGKKWYRIAGGWVKEKKKVNPHGC